MSVYLYCIRQNYKYQSVITGREYENEWLRLSKDGMVVVKGTHYKGYAWDGPSGPTIDTRTFMRGSLVHDALYQLMRDGYLDKEFREPADRLLKSMCKKDGMYWIRAWWVHLGVHFGAGFAVDPASRKPLILAPKSCK